MRAKNSEQHVFTVRTDIQCISESTWVMWFPPLSCNLDVTTIFSTNWMVKPKNVHIKYYIYTYIYIYINIVYIYDIHLFHISSLAPHRPRSCRWPGNLPRNDETPGLEASDVVRFPGGKSCRVMGWIVDFCCCYWGWDDWEPPLKKISFNFQFIHSNTLT